MRGDFPKRLKFQIYFIYIATIFFFLDLIAPIEYLYFTEKNLSLTDIMVCHSCFSASLMLFEVPSGYIADKFSYRAAFFVAKITMFLSAFCLYFYDERIWINIAMILAGISVAFFSGTDQAILYESLKEYDVAEDFQVVLAKKHAAEDFAGLIGGMLTALLASTSFKLVGLVNLLAAGVLCFVPFLLYNPAKTLHKDKKNLRQSFSKLLSGSFFIFGIFTCIFSLSTLLGVKFSQPLLSQAHLSVFWFGVFWSVSKGLGIFGAFLGPLIFKRFSIKIFGPIILSLPLLILGFSFLLSHPLVAFCLLALFPALRNLGSIYVSSEMNILIPSAYRATANSFVSMIFRSMFLFLGPIAGFFAEKYGIGQTLSLCSLLLFSIYLLCYIGIFYFKKSKKTFQEI